LDKLQISDFAYYTVKRRWSASYMIVYPIHCVYSTLPYQKSRAVAKTQQ